MSELRECKRLAADLYDALLLITDHFADVMGGPMIAGWGIKFVNGVESIPTIATARVALAKARGETP